MPDSPGPRFGVAAPLNSGADAMTGYRTGLRALEDALEAYGLVWRGQGTLAARPAASVQGGVYKVTDTGYESTISYDTGAAWVEIGSGATVDGSAGTPSLRTLGSGSTQAAAGNHTHAGTSADDVQLLTLIGAL